MTTTVNVRVENHTCDHDVTYAYLQNADWAPSEGVQYNAEECTLSGDNPEQVWADYKSLAAVIAELGHGDSSETEAPILSACPAELIDLYSGGASEALARMNSVECDTWGEFVASVPSLTK